MTTYDSATADHARHNPTLLERPKKSSSRPVARQMRSKTSWTRTATMGVEDRLSHKLEHSDMKSSHSAAIVDLNVGASNEI